MDIVILLLLGLCFGSFTNALVWRLYMQSKSHKKGKKPSHKYSISRGHSMCVHCQHRLSTTDLIPVFSWVFLRGKCRYCHKPISWQYPLVEIITAGLFVFSYVYWPYETSNLLGQMIFALWLVFIVGFMALIVYDLRWMLLPNRIIFFLYFVALAYSILRVLQIGDLSSIVDILMGVVVGGGIFYLLFQVSNARWIGGGDVKFGFLLGALVGSPYYALLALFIASLLGTAYSVPLLATKKATKTSRIPFGPFLIASTIIVVLFGATISDWYLEVILG